MRVNLVVNDKLVITGVITDPISDKLPIVEIESLSDIKVGYDTYENERIIAQELPTAVANKKRIFELKKLLADTDYLCWKHVDGALTDEEYEATRLQRQAWRDEINLLEE